MEMGHKDHVGGIRIKSLAHVCIVICGVLFAITYMSISRVDESYHHVIESSNDCIEGQECAVNLERKSDYLTDEVRLFVISQDTDHLYEYFKEVDSKNREHMVERLAQICGEEDSDAVEQLSKALQESHALEDSEIHAMKLIAFNLQLAESVLPAPVAEWKLTQEELAMTVEERRLIAYDLVYGEEYLKRKYRIEQSTDKTFKLLTEVMVTRQKESGRALERTLLEQRICTFFMMLLVVSVFGLVGVLLVYPVTQHVRSIQSNKPWKSIGGHEIRYLADIYNHLYAKNAMYREELQYKAEHDALTGICNREIFEQKKDLLRGRDIHIALLLLDIDEFKNVNDSLGHDVGDEALCRVASFLKKAEENENVFAARIGGDEFAVILTEATKEHYPKIQQEIDHLNEILQEGEGGIPSLSVSVGVAFSEKGYSTELFHQADMALYFTKKHGRQGCSSYDEIEVVK